MFSKRKPRAEALNIFKYQKWCIKAVWKLCGFSKCKPHAEVRNFKISEMLHKRCVDTVWVFKMQTAHRGTQIENSRRAAQKNASALKIQTAR